MASNAWDESSQQKALTALKDKGVKALEALESAIADSQTRMFGNKDKVRQQFRSEIGDYKIFFKDSKNPGYLANQIEHYFETAEKLQKKDTTQVNILEAVKPSGYKFWIENTLPQLGRMLSFYEEVTSWSHDCGRPGEEWKCADEFWTKHPRKHTAGIDPYAGRRISAEEQSKRDLAGYATELPSTPPRISAPWQTPQRKGSQRE